MPKLKEIRGVLADNVYRLRKEFAPAEYRSINKFAKWCQVGNNAISALEDEDGSGDPQLSTLVKVAGKFGLEPWHLFTPELDPRFRPHAVNSKEMSWHLYMERVPKDVGAETGRFAAYPAPTKKKVAERRRKK